MTDTRVRTRFAPSPTGYLHVGGARTALFNYLLARQTNGVFVLRVEDTDRSRNVAGAEQKLLDDLRWLGLQWDEGPDVGGNHGPYRQSERLTRYEECYRTLLDQGAAYYAFDTVDELDALRRDAERRKANFRYPRPTTFPSERDAQRARDEGRPVVVRFKMPAREFRVPDVILGEVAFEADALDDFVIVKSDGWPTYHCAVVIDDEDMQITHVLRGQEHLMNTPRHMALQEALGYRTPVYAHLPIILNMDGSKMGKRDKDKAVRATIKEALAAERIESASAAQLARCSSDEFAGWLKKKSQLDSEALGRLGQAVGIELPEVQVHDFRASGYLPEVLVNFLALLGWSAGDDRERYTLDELCTAFRPERIGRTNARFDRDKLLSFSTTALADAAAPRLLDGMRDYLVVNPESPLAGIQDESTLSKVLELTAGMRTFRDVETKAGAMFVDDDALQFDTAAVRKVLLKGTAPARGLDVLEALRAELARIDATGWTVAAIERVVREFAEGRGLGLGKVAQPLRVAVTGATISPAIFETLALIGMNGTLRRIDRAIEHAQSLDA